MMGVYKVRNDTCEENLVEKVKPIKNRKKRKVLKTCLYCMHYRKGCGCVVQPCPYAEDHIQRNCYTAKDTYRIFVEGVIEKERSMLQEQIEVAKERIQTMDSIEMEQYLEVEEIMRYADMEELNREMVEAFIERVDMAKDRTITIIWKFNMKKTKEKL